MLTATEILGSSKRLLKPSDVLCPVDLDSLAERIAALSVRASGTSAGATLGWDTRHQWQPAHAEGDPAGLPSGKIKHAVLVIGGKRFKGPSHFQALMQYESSGEPEKYIATHPGNRSGRPIQSEMKEGFETESGHFLDRMQAADYALHLKQREPGYLHTLCSEELHLSARDGQLYTQDAVQGTHVAEYQRHTPSGGVATVREHDRLPTDFPGEFKKEISTWKHVSKSPYSSSFYDVPDKGWHHTPEGSLRIADHWNFKTDGDDLHATTDKPVQHGHWALGKYEGGTDAIQQSHTTKEEAEITAERLSKFQGRERSEFTITHKNSRSEKESRMHDDGWFGEGDWDLRNTKMHGGGHYKIIKTLPRNATLPDAHGSPKASQGQGHPGSSATVHGAEQVSRKPLSRDFNCGENEIQASLINFASAGATPAPATISATIVHEHQRTNPSGSVSTVKEHEDKRESTEPLFNDTYTGKRYTYGLSNRPLHSSHVPKGFIFHSNKPHPDFNFGTVDYPKPISFADEDAFELTPLDPNHPKNIKKQIKVEEDALDVETEWGDKGFRHGNRLYTKDPSSGGDKWRMTYFTDAGEPSGHELFEDYTEARGHAAKERAWDKRKNVRASLAECLAYEQLDQDHCQIIGRAVFDKWLMGSTVKAREPVSTYYDPRNEAEAKHAEAVKKALAVAEASALANAKEKDDAKAKRRREEAAALALLLLGAAGAASYALLAPHLLRVAVAGAPSQGPLPMPSAPATLPEAPAPVVTLPAVPEAPTPIQPLGISVSPAQPEQESDMLGGKTLEQAAEDFADERAEFLKPFCADIQEAMRLEVEIGKANGESIHQIGRRLFDLANGIGRSRGALIAATEAQSAYGHAQLRALAAAGYRTANWIQVDRETKRESHAENVLAGPLPIGDTWPNGQKFPGDPIGGPGECINCLCELTGADWHKPKPKRVLTRRQQLRKERLAKRNTAKASDHADSAAVKAAGPEFGCLMAMLPELNSGIAAVASRIEPEDLAEDGVENEAHTTVLYGFNLGFDSQRLMEVLRGFGPFEAKLGKLSRFECPEYDVVKFDVHSDKLRALNARIANEFKQDITPSKWDYNPHVTVAYVKKGAAQGLDGSSLEGRKIEVKDLLYSLPKKQVRVEFKLGDDAKASDSTAPDTIQAVHIKEYERKTKTGGMAEVHEHEDKRTKQSAPVPMGQVSDKAKELAAGVTWKHGVKPAESSKFPTGPHIHKSRESGDIEMRDATPEERKQLAIPPAYGVAKVPTSPDSPILWKAIAPNGKVQLRRSETQAGKQLQAKHERGHAFQKELPEIKSAWEKEIKDGGKNLHEALVLRLIHQTGFRNGGETGGGKVAAFGASSLRAEHVTVEGDKIHFKFTGKGGHLQDHELTDAVLAEHFAKQKADGKDRMFDTNASNVLNYLHTIDGQFIVHDFRTHVATRTAAAEVAKRLEGGMPKSIKEAKEWMKSALTLAAEKIGDTIAVAKSTYVNPQVFARIGL